VTADERTLVERAQSGDAQAFGRIYQRYVDRVYSFVSFRVRDQQLAEDLTQEVFVQALRALDSYDWRGSLAPWLLRIARNTVVDHWRRSSRRPERPLSAIELDNQSGEESIDALALEADTSNEEAFVRADGALDRQRILAAAEHLTDLQQQVLALRFASGLSIRETADTMGRTEGAIKNLQHHAVRALRRKLEEDEAKS
jgi:RNA polymerase sigma-70 factor (ECF subfamily)